MSLLTPCVGSLVGGFLFFGPVFVFGGGACLEGGSTPSWSKKITVLAESSSESLCDLVQRCLDCWRDAVLVIYFIHVELSSQKPHLSQSQLCHV